MNPLPFAIRDPALPPWLRPEGAYVHIPFCRHHCGYCDFAVAVGRDDQIDNYLQGLEAEMARLERPHAVQTLFLGGGTPSYLDEEALERLLTILKRWVPLREGHEFSLEANPESLTAEKVRLLADHGVNRISLGAQSFRQDILRTLERPHEPTEVFQVLEMISGKFPEISLDLIFGVPGQTLKDWTDDLTAAIGTGVTHVATYGLTYEKGTRLWKEMAGGRLTPLPEEKERSMYAAAIDLLQAAGLKQYEISNFAFPGSECRHNRTYWANHAHLGFGMGAASYVGGIRRLNVRSLDGYVRRAISEQATWFQEETLEPGERAMETAALQLRRREGIHREDFRTQTGIDLAELLGSTIGELKDIGLVEEESGWVSLSEEGKFVADEIVGKMYRQRDRAGGD